MLFRSLAASGSQIFILKGDTLSPLSRGALGQPQNSAFAQQSNLFPKVSPEELKRQDSIARMKTHIASLQQERDIKLAKQFNDINQINHQLSRNSLVRYGVTIVVLIFLALGLARWWRTDQWKEKILFQEYTKALGNDTPCQSCGMRLKFDKDYKEGQIYCHECYDGYDFVDTEMTLKAMKKKIRNRMKTLCFNKWQIWSHTRKLRSYTRWVKQFKW